MARVLITIVTVAVLAAVGAGLVVLGSPASARERRFDERREEDLAAIAVAIDNHAALNRGLPKSLDDLEQVDRESGLTGPVTGRRYEYAAIDSERYDYARCSASSRRARPRTGGTASGVRASPAEHQPSSESEASVPSAALVTVLSFLCLLWPWLVQSKA